MSEPKWLTVARGELGTAEIEGPKSNSRIVQYAKEAAGMEAPDSDAWCATFVGAMLARDGLDETKGTGKRNARSYMEWGKALEEPVLGCIVVFWRVSKSSWQGHVAFWLKEDKTHVWCLGGNQSNKVSIARYPKKQVLGYRWPTAADPPKPAPVMDPQLKRVQIRLKELGYHDVGIPDGKWGTKTRGALLSFKADWNEEHPGTKDDLPMPTGKIDKASLLDQATLAALMEAPQRPVSPARETADETAIEDYAAVKDAKQTTTVAKVGLTAGGIWAAIQSGIADQIANAVYAFQAIKDAIAPYWSIILPLLPIVVIGVFLFIWLRQRKIRKEEIESFRMGETP